MKRLISFIVLCIILAVGGILAYNTSTKSNTTDVAPLVPTITEAPSPTVSPPHFYHVGETVTAQPWEITLKSAKIVDPAIYPQHDQIFPSLKPDDRFLILDEHLKNISSKEQNIAGMQFGLQDKDGNRNFSEQGGVPDVQNPGLGGNVSQTMEMSGQEAYIIPNSVHLLYWVYNPMDTKSNQVIWQIDL